MILSNALCWVKSKFATNSGGFCFVNIEVYGILVVITNFATKTHAKMPLLFVLKNLDNQAQQT